MGAPVLQEKRRQGRKRLTGLMPGRLMMIESERNVSARPIDVSQNGLGLLIAEEIRPGTKMRLKTQNQEIEFEVLWGQPDFGRRDLFRYGLVTSDPSVDLVDLFTQTGCLK